MSHQNLFELNSRSPRQPTTGYFQGLPLHRGPAQRSLDQSASITSLNSVSSVGSAFRLDSLSSLGYSDHLHHQQHSQSPLQQPQLHLLTQQSQQPQSQQAWAYTATLNGAVNGSSRRPTRRQPLPQAWVTEPISLGMGHQAYPGSSTLSTPVSLSGLPSDLEQLIPTAIVIKNIPFSVRKETLAAVMLDLNLPQPYAFNYHFDNGVFRGLAFANFQSPEDTRVVIDAMNGMEVQGRKLRVEYKKMLPEAERERIEREKRERRGQLEEQHRAPISVVRGSPLRDVDLNDPQTLTFYTELEVFRRDDTREIIIFPATIAPEQRRRIHILAHHMGLEHESVGDAECRQIHVLKRHNTSPTAPLNSSAVVAAAAAAALDSHNKRGLSRAATFDFAGDSRPAAATHFPPGRPTLELPGSPEGNNFSLRTAKSFTDLRSWTPSPSHASSSYQNGAAAVHYGTYNSVDPHLISPPSVGSLFESQPPRQPAPSAIGSQRTPFASRNAPERQPRGPEWEMSGFRRHAQRASEFMSYA